MRALWLDGTGGVDLAAVEWPGDPDRSVLAVHATGFCKEVWDPVASALSEAGIRVVAFDQRGHGSSSQPPDADWWGLGADAAAVAAELGPFAVGLGHSSGATAITMAALSDPGLLRSLVAVEPVVFPPHLSYDYGLADQARRRRSSFESVDAARAHFEGRGIFADWVPAALEGYLRGGLRCGDGGCELACSSELEARFYELGMTHGLWDRLGDLAVPVRLIIGERSTYHTAASAAELAERFGADLEVAPGTDHFLPMQRPDLVVKAVLASLGA